MNLDADGAEDCVFVCDFFKLSPSFFIVLTEFVVLSEFCFLASENFFSSLDSVFVLLAKWFCASDQFIYSGHVFLAKCLDSCDLLVYSVLMF